MPRPVCAARRGVLEGHRVAEAHQHALIVALNDRPVESAHGLLASLLEVSQHVGLSLRVEILQVGVGLEQFAAADQDRHLAALGLAGAGSGRGMCLGAWPRWGRGRRVRLAHEYHVGGSPGRRRANGPD